MQSRKTSRSFSMGCHVEHAKAVSLHCCGCLSFQIHTLYTKLQLLMKATNKDCQAEQTCSEIIIGNRLACGKLRVSSFIASPHHQLHLSTDSFWLFPLGDASWCLSGLGPKQPTMLCNLACCQATNFQQKRKCNKLTL